VLPSALNSASALPCSAGQAQLKVQVVLSQFALHLSFQTQVHCVFWSIKQKEMLKNIQILWIDLGILFMNINYRSKHELTMTNTCKAFINRNIKFNTLLKLKLYLGHSTKSLPFQLWKLKYKISWIYFFFLHIYEMKNEWSLKWPQIVLCHLRSYHWFYDYLPNFFYIFVIPVTDKSITIQ